MKKLNYLWMLGLLMFAAVNFCACSSDDDGPGSSSELVGLWEGVSVEGSFKYAGETEEFEEELDDIRIRFNSDGTCESYEYYGGSWSFVSEATWEYKNGKLYTTYEEDGDMITDAVPVKELTSSRLVLEYHEKDEDWESYEVMTFKKVN